MADGSPGLRLVPEMLPVVAAAPPLAAAPPVLPSLPGGGVGAVFAPFCSGARLALVGGSGGC